LAAVFKGVRPLLSAANLPNPPLLVGSLICPPKALPRTQRFWTQNKSGALNFNSLILVPYLFTPFLPRFLFIFLMSL
jgi:hypothetical protein